MITCGGCQGLGNHAKVCSEDKGPRAAMYYQAANSLGSLGDTIGSNDMGMANALWSLAAEAEEKAHLAALATKEWRELNGKA